MNKLTLLTARTTANGKPTGNAGVPIWFGHPEHLVTEGLYRGCNEASCVVSNSAGTGAVALGYVRIWCRYLGTLWCPLGVGTDADKGKLNQAGGFALGAVDTDQLRHEEIIVGFRNADRIYAEIFGLGGAGSPAFDVALVAREIVLE